MMEVLETTGAIRHTKLKSSPPVNQHPTFNRPDVLRPTNSVEALKENA